MADEQLDPEIIRKLNAGIALSADETARLAANASLATKALMSTTASLKAMGKSVGDLGKAMYQGEQGTAMFGRATMSATESVGDLVSEFGLLGKVLGFFIKSVGKYANEVTELSDRLFKNYQQLSKSGVTASDGMMGLAQAAQQLGFGIDQVGLEQFSRLIADASKDLAVLGGSAVQGRKQFTAFATSIVRSETGERLRAMGMSVEDINTGIAAFISDQARLGRIAGRTNADLRQSAVSYIEQMDKLARLTGEDVKSLQARIDADAREERFRAALLKVERDQGAESAKILQQNIAAVGKVAPDVAQGLKDISAGFVNTEAAQKLFRMGITQIPREMTQQLGGGFNEINAAAKRTSDQFGITLGAVSAFNNVFPDLAQLVELGQLSFHDYNKIVEQITKDQAAGGDAAVKAQVQVEIAQMNTRDSLQSLVLKGVNPATQALSGLADVANQVVTGLGGTVGAAPAGGYAGMGNLGDQTPPTPAAPAAAPSMGRGMSRTPQAPAAGGGVTRNEAEEIIARELFNFMGSRTGNERNFQQLSPAFRDRLAAMAKEYNELTGKKLDFTSGARTAEENRAVGGVGTSNHMKGTAVDLSTRSVNELVKLGLLDKYGFKQNSRSAWHISDTGFRNGGISTGPESGYHALLHGTEAVVPLPDGNSIPVSIDFGRTMLPQLRTAIADEITAAMNTTAPAATAAAQATDQFKNMMQTFLDRQAQQNLAPMMQELIDLQRNQNRTSEKMLLRSTS